MLSNVMLCHSGMFSDHPYCLKASETAVQGGMGEN